MIIDSFTLHLKAEGKSPSTIRTYTDAALKFAREQLTENRSVAARRGRESNLGIDRFDTVTRTDVEKHVVSLLERYSPGYASNQFRALQQFFKWLAEEEDIPNPMRGLRAPQPAPKAVPVLGEGEIDALLKVCRGRRLKQRRDTALLLLFRDTGCRLSELANVSTSDVDLRSREMLVTGKGGRERWVKFGAQAAVAVDRYLRLRNSRYEVLGELSTVQSETGSVWGLTPNGVYQMVKRRGQQAGVKIHPHMFRHSFAHVWLDNGGAEGDLMQLAGWRSAQMLRRYGASAAASRARRSYDRIMGQ